MRRLPETDLARIAVLPSGNQASQLVKFRDSIIPLNYNPLRKAYTGLLNIQGPLLPDATRPKWSTVRDAVEQNARFPKELETNLSVARGLYKFAEMHDVSGRPETFMKMQLRAGEAVSFLHPAVLSVDGAPVVAFFDPRDSNKLSIKARQLVLSLMHEQLRVPDPDFAQVGLAIIQFGPKREVSDGIFVREPIFIRDTEIDLLPFEEAEEMVASVYSQWRVLLRKGSAARRPAANDHQRDLFEGAVA